MHEASLVVCGFTKRSVEERPSSTIPVIRSVEVPSAVSEQVLHGFYSREITAQSRLV